MQASDRAVVLRSGSPRHGQQLGAKPCKQQVRLAPVNCLRCASKQLQQCFMLPETGLKDKDPGITISHGTNPASNAQDSSHTLGSLCDLRQQERPGQPQQLASWEQHWHTHQQDDLQLAYAGCSSSSSSTRDRLGARGPTSNVQLQPRQQLAGRALMWLGSRRQIGGSSGICAGADHASSSSSATTSSSGSSDQAVIDGLPSLSSLVNQPSSTAGANQPPSVAGYAKSGSAVGSSSELAGSSSSGAQQQQGDELQQEQEDSAGVKAALAMLKWYKSVLSPMMQSTCRFLPTCSQYSMDSYRSYGVAKGTVLTAWRLLRCNPWGPSGYDPTQWPPPGLAWLFQYRYSAEVAVVVGAAAFVRLSHALLFE